MVRSPPAGGAAPRAALADAAPVPEAPVAAGAAAAEAGASSASSTPSCQRAVPSRTSTMASATHRIRWRSWVTSTTVPG